MYEPHPAFITPLSDAVLWRYMDFVKFVSLLERKALFFAKASHLGDPFEGSLAQSTVAEIQRMMLVNPEVLHEDLRQHRSRHLVNCWHEGAYESAAMWRLYGQQIAIRTTSDRLCRSFVCRNDIYVGKVLYADYETADISLENLFNLYLHKRRSFEHEREVRAITYMEEGATAAWTGQYYAVDVEMLIEQVVVAPYADEWFIDLVQAGGPIEKICEIEIELPDYATRRYKRTTAKKRNKKTRKAATNGTSNTTSGNRKAGAKQGVIIAEMKPKRAKGKSTPRPPKPESLRAAHKRSQENARKMQMALF